MSRTLFVLAVSAAIALTAPPLSAAALPGPISATVVKVVDGDTITIRARIWLDQDIGTSVRLAAIDTPELKARCPGERAKAVAARDHLRKLVGSGPVLLTEVKRDKYAGRVVARVSVRGRDVAEQLIAAGIGRPYKGGKRAGWC